MLASVADLCATLLTGGAGEQLNGQKQVLATYHEQDFQLEKSLSSQSQVSPFAAEFFCSC